MDRAAVWRVHIGEDAELQRTMLESGTIALVAAGEAAISDEEWGAFASDVRTGDWILVALEQERVGIGRIAGPVRERPGQQDRRLRRTRPVKWLRNDLRRARLARPAPPGASPAELSVLNRAGRLRSGAASGRTVLP